MISALSALLTQFREQTLSVRDQGTSFEKLMLQYFKTEPFYQSQYREIFRYGDWVTRYGEPLGITSKQDTGIDLVAVTPEGQHHAIQCKNYGADKTINKTDIDSFFTASGKTYFSQRIIVTTTNHWTENAQRSLENQQPPVSTLDLHALENSIIDWSAYQVDTTQPVLKAQKQLRDHQQQALNHTLDRFKTADRGKLIMACGTGKTFTSLKIAEAIAGKGKRVLFLVPSLSLLSQTITEWTQESALPLTSFAVCSDSDVGKRQTKADDDRVITGLSDLQYPATTHAETLNRVMNTRPNDDSMTVVFSTYHSIAVLNEAQQQGLPAFDLIICDEAHRTTGATFDGEEESAFVRVHDNSFIQGHKRLYMTATPRIYGDDAKKTEGVTLCSMDDESIYGKDLYVITFSEAVARKLLVDYKVIVLAIEEAHINRRLQTLLTNQSNSLKVDDAAKIVGCWKALSKQDLLEGNAKLAEPMKRAVAFCQVIEKQYQGKKHKVSSKQIAEMFGAVVAQYQDFEKNELLNKDSTAPLDPALLMRCEAQHVDGTMNASEKEAKLSWLKATTEENTCRILSNVRCLAEGVDIPALDAVLFLTPRHSQVEVVQSVGRVMRTVKDENGNDLKKMGYVILPVVIPAGVEPEVALNNNETYRVVWQVLNALRAHDDRFDAMINKLEFNGTMPAKMEVIAIADKVTRKGERVNKQQRQAGQARGGNAIGNVAEDYPAYQYGMQFEVGEIERALYAKIVKKCGNRHHWEDWATDIAKIANTHIDRIKAILENQANSAEIAAFNTFAAELRDDLNNSISDAEIIEMLAQHLITQPVFEALFAQYHFAQHNPMSQALQRVLDTLHAQQLDKERDTLESFYESVKMRAEGIHSAEGKQRIVIELYDKFFRNAFPRMTERLGIVYTPIEVVDFIIHSVEHVLNSEFNSSLAEKNVHILDPFTGTGTFITRLLQSGIIPLEKLPNKYQQEIHANEIVLLAYYIAAINIEATYHGILNGNITGQENSDNTLTTKTDYQPFNGICLTDTFQMTETPDWVDKQLEENSARRKRQQSLDIRVIMGNPPYSAGQESANDNNANVAYPKLDERIRRTYAEHSTATLKNALYDSYIRAIRWSSDRIKDRGVIGFVTNGGFLEANTADGLRKCLAEEFSNLYIFHLRGNQRTSGERSRKEGGKIFGSGSRAPIAISILVKNPDSSAQGQIYFYDIGDYLSQKEKLEIIAELGSIQAITAQHGWQPITPDRFGDWLNQRDPNFDSYISLGDKKDKNAKVVFENYSRGIATSRDAWCYNASKIKLQKHIQKSINFYNSEVQRYLDEKSQLKAEDFAKFDSTSFTWDSANKWDLEKGKFYPFDSHALYKAIYRPFTGSNLYFHRLMNNRVYQMPQIFPTPESENWVISVTGLGTPKEFSCVITNVIPDIQLHANGQCFPLYLYEKAEPNMGLFAQAGIEAQYQRREAITNEALAHFQAAYPELSISKEDIFYTLYGLLHSEDYREQYADNLSKQLPRIPRVKTAQVFSAFTQAGRDLAALHLNYETVVLNTTAKLTGKTKGLTITANGVIGGQDSDFYVTQMKFGKTKDSETGKSVEDKTTVIYNPGITIEHIPLESYDYIVNGKPALEWVMERQSVTTDKKSGITNDANDWALETMGNAKYPLELFLRVITVSLKTQAIVGKLPKLEI
ncbi:DNA damage-inducible protein [Candidatus Nitrosoglobus terrae]|uniref:DNA damage-inducible protein n=1 Tax=Candidatus Nitrosoglobus terrae TaxID=1630141 RepID=A0A1Q2SN30_9GAMM|nr:type ISP restriction/modification enzyme [Candidatus Nitrosoglobus terrae]BAW80540.1 DNA damage-inducible protein [Candidatus Nitrosoglobus terrae]